METPNKVATEIKADVEKEEAEWEEYWPIEESFDKGDVGKCVAYFQERLQSGDHPDLTMQQLAGFCFSALNQSDFFGISPAKLKTESVAQLGLFMKSLALNSYVEGKTGKMEQSLACLSRVDQLDNLLMVAKYLNGDLALHEKGQAEEFLKALEGLEEHSLDFLPYTNDFINTLNKKTKAALKLMDFADPKAIGLRLAALNQKPIGDYLLLYEYEGKPFYLNVSGDSSQVWLHRTNEYSETPTTVESKSQKAFPQAQSRAYFYDTIDEHSMTAMASKLEEAARTHIKCLYVELPIFVFKAFKRANRTGHFDALQETLLQVESSLPRVLKTEQEIQLHINAMKNFIKLIELAYKNNIQVLPVFPQPLSILGVPLQLPQSKVAEFLQYESYTSQMANTMYVFNKSMNFSEGEGYIGFFNIAFSEMCRDLQIPSHAFLHTQSTQAMPPPQALPKGKIQPVLSHGLFKLGQPLDEVTVVGEHAEEKQELMVDKVLVQNAREASQYLTPLILKISLYKGKHPTKWLTQEEAINVCLIANNLTEEEARKLVTMNQDLSATSTESKVTEAMGSDENPLRTLFALASQMAQHLPEYFKNYLPNPYTTPLGQLLKVRHLFTEEQFSKAISGDSRGLLFYQGHDDLESYECLIAALPLMANNPVKPLKHIYLELPVELTPLLEALYNTGDASDIEKTFTLSKDQFTSPRSATLIMRLILEANKHKIKIFAVDSTSMLRGIGLSMPGSASVQKSIFEYSDKAMAQEITKHNAALGAEESFIGLFGMLHRSVGDRICKCSNWGFLPRNYLKQEMSGEANPKNIAKQISDEASPLSHLIKQVLPHCDEVLVTWPCDIEKQKEEVASGIFAPSMK